MIPVVIVSLFVADAAPSPHLWSLPAELIWGGLLDKKCFVNWIVQQTSYFLTK